MKKGPSSDLQRVRSLKKYTSCVHVVDICNALKKSIQKPSPGKIYNIVDDDPAPRSKVFSFAHELINEKWPSQIKEGASPATNESFTNQRSLRGDKRVVNERMKNELGVSLLHPSYRLDCKVFLSRCMITFLQVHLKNYTIFSLPARST